MTEDRTEVKPEEMQVYIERAHQMRAEALRASFVDFRKAVKSLFYRIGHLFDIPRIENTKRV